jgi:hypothetical protein
MSRTLTARARSAHARRQPTISPATIAAAVAAVVFAVAIIMLLLRKG